MIKGTYIFSQDGKEIHRSENIITKFGKRFFTNFIAGNINDLEKDMAFGIGSTAASEDDTRLEFEFTKQRFRKTWLAKLKRVGYIHLQDHL